MKPEDIGFIKDAIAIITAGITNRVDSKDKSISVYRVKNIIRVDIKNVQIENKPMATPMEGFGLCDDQR